MSQKGMRGNRYLTDEEMANKPKVTKELLMRIASYLLPYTKQMLLVLSLIVISSIFSLLPSIITGNFYIGSSFAQNICVPLTYEGDKTIEFDISLREG